VKLAGWLVLAACGARPASPAEHGAPYRVLFERGKTWTLPIEASHGHFEQPSRYVVDETSRGKVTCRVSDVRTTKLARLATLRCGAPYADLLIVGPWVATAAGLFHPPVTPDDDELAAYTAADALIAAVPKDRQSTEGDADSTSSSEAFELDHAWCVRETHAAQLDRCDFTLCLDERGVSGGTDLVIAGPSQDWHRVHFGKAPGDPDDPTVQP
jgi:hypothetical protein